MELCLSLLEDHVLLQATPISAATLLDLCPSTITIGCARRALAQFAIDHQDSVCVILAVTFIEESRKQLGVRLIRVEDLNSLSGTILSCYVYSIEMAQAGDSTHISNAKDREQCLVAYRIAVEQELPMLIRQPQIHYPNGGPQRRQKEPEKALEPNPAKRKIEEPEPEKQEKKVPTKEQSVAMAAFFARKPDRPTLKAALGSRNQTVKSESKPPDTRKGVAVKKPKIRDRKPVSMSSNLASESSSQESDEDRDMELDNDDASGGAVSDRDDDDNTAVVKDENEAPAVPSSKTALSKQVVHRTYVQNKYLVTEDVVHMVETEVPDNAPSKKTHDLPQAESANKVKRTAPRKAKAKDAKTKSVQTSLKSYFSKRSC